jgi:predicted DNA-binding protein YlxM (UPF0122 family)
MRNISEILRLYLVEQLFLRKIARSGQLSIGAVQDKLRCGVSIAYSYDPRLNPSYQQLAVH